jgi:hypothetical protein
VGLLIILQLTIANLLPSYQPIPQPASSGANDGRVVIEPLFAGAKEDVKKMLEILEHVGNAAPEMQKTRTDVLRKAFENIHW